MRVVGAQRPSLESSETEKMEHKTKKSLSYKAVCDIKMRGLAGVSHVGGKRQSLPTTGPEPGKMENETKKCLSYKPVCDIKMSNTSEHTRALEGNSHSVPGSPGHIVQCLYDYLSTHLFPIWMSCVQLGCNVPE